MAVTAPPAEPTAGAIRPIDAGSPSAVSRTVIEYEAEVTGPRGRVADSPRVVSSAPAEGVVCVLISPAMVPPRRTGAPHHPSPNGSRTPRELSRSPGGSLVDPRRAGD